MGLLDGKVAVVTGGGRGLGREYALAFAAAGAAVVVNDLGGALRGGGHDPAPADEVAQEIVAAGGSAVADHTDVGSIDGGRALVQAALDAFGQVDSVVHSAGITRQTPIPELDRAAMDSLLGVHLFGALGLVQGAFAHMADGGNVTLIVSGAGLEPQWPNTTAYACAKAAVYALMKVAAVEGAARDIRVNAVSPFALTRMSADMLSGNPDAGDLDPARVAPMVVFLASHLAHDVTGRVLRVEGRRIGAVHFARGPAREGDWTPEGIASALPALLES